jgi:hypothetical protein
VPFVYIAADPVDMMVWAWTILNLLSSYKHVPSDLWLRRRYTGRCPMHYPGVGRGMKYYPVTMLDLSLALVHC